MCKYGGFDCAMPFFHAGVSGYPDRENLRLANAIVQGTVLAVQREAFLLALSRSGT